MLLLVVIDVVHMLVINDGQLQQCAGMPTAPVEPL